MALCTRGVQTAQGRSLSQEGALRTMKLPTLPPVSGTVLCPEGVSVLSCCRLDTPFVNPDMGEKKTEFSPRSVPAAHIPLQEEAPQQVAPLGLPCPAGWLRGGFPALAQNVSSSPWQVFLLQPMNWACGQLEISALGGGLTP